MAALIRRLLGFMPFHIATAVTIFVLAAMLNPTLRERLYILQLFENTVFDFRMQIRGIEPVSGDVVIVAIDDKTLQTLGRWPFSRSRMADAVHNLKADGASAISWDVVFSEPDQNSELVRMRELRSRLEQLGLDGRDGNERQRLENFRRDLMRAAARLPQSQRDAYDNAIRDVDRQIAALRERQGRFYRDVVRAEAEADNDRYFAAAISEAGNVILGYFHHRTTDDIGAVMPERIERHTDLIRPSRIGLVRTSGDIGDRLPGLTGVDLEVNIPELSAATPHFGFFSIIQDSDGTIRRYPVVMEWQNDYYPSLALISVALHDDAPVIVSVESEFGHPQIREVRVGSRRLPVDELGQLLINYRGPQRQFPVVSFSDVVLGTFPPGTFENRIALIGPTAIGIMDLRVTPFDQSMPGVEVHANAIDNILTGEFYQRPQWMLAFDILAVIAIGLILGVGMAPLRSVYGAIAVGVVGLAYLLGGQWLLESYGIWLTTVYPLLELVMVFAGVTVYKYYTEERKRKEVRSAFQYYLSPAVIDQVLQDPDRLRLGGEKRVLTVMFSDVRGFTTISEALDAEELSNLLNEYLTPMTRLIFEAGGTLDKYMGDALMAFWGAPLLQEDHAIRACETALQMMEELENLKVGWNERGLPPIDVGIGMNTGTMSVGNMGSEQRFDYTVMGDAVNLGSRIEGINKEYGTHIIIGPQTWEMAHKQFFCRELDMIVVKGKKEPVKIYELISRTPTPAQAQLVEAFTAALTLYRKGDFQAAYTAFQAVLREFPGDGPSTTFLERSRELMENPPEGEWNGVYVATSK